MAILDYGMGNLRSVSKAVEQLGFSPVVQLDLRGAEKLIIPGVGAFGAAMERLGPLRDDIRSFAESGQPLLGICLGQQLLFETSEEMGQHRGLELVPGRVRYLPATLKVPQIGWNEALFLENSKLGQGINLGEQVYFVHSLYCDCSASNDVAAITHYGIEFASAVERANVWGVQFHPEKSGEAGLKILQNFLEC